MSTSASLPLITASMTIRGSKRWSTRRSKNLWRGASERPDQRYGITILNSPAINAFAVRSGQLYAAPRPHRARQYEIRRSLPRCCRGRWRRVIASHTAIREDKARQVALGSRVVNDLLADSEQGALALSQIKVRARRFSRVPRNSKRTASASAAQRAPASILTARCVFSVQWDATPILKRHRLASKCTARPTSSPRIRQPRSACKNAQNNAPQLGAPASAARATAAPISRRSTAWSMATDPSEGLVKGRRFLHPKLGFSFVAPESFALDNTHNST